MKRYLYALATFSGTIIGVGLFGLPYVAAQIGFIPILFYFAVLGTIILIIQLMFGEICLRTSESHRLPGYAEIYLNKKAKILSVISNSLGLYGANLAYIIIGGGFLANLLMPIFGGSVLIYTLIFFTTGAFIIFLGSKTIARSELFSLILFFGVLIFLIIKGSPHINPEYLFDINYKNLFLPYGVILFSLGGMAIIPEAREILGQKGKLLKSVIVVGAIIPIITYVAFIFLVLGVTGPDTTTDALTGLKAVLGQNILIAGFLFGIITTFTSYLTLGLTLKKIYWYDLKFSHFNSWLIACLVPIILYVAGLQNFILIIGFTGAVTLGVDVILISLIYLKAKKKGQRIPDYKVNIPKTIVYLLIGLFLVGVVTQLVSLR